MKRAKSTAWATLRLGYLRLARCFRSPKEPFPAWPIAVLTIGPLFTGAMTLILFDLAGATWMPMSIGFLIGAVGAGGLFSAILFWPTDELLLTAIAEADREREEAAQDADSQAPSADHIGQSEVSR